MPLDPQARAFLDQMAAQSAAAPPPPLDQLPPATVRELFNGLLLTLDGPPEPIARVAERQLPGPAGPLAVRVYTPQGPGPFPALLYFHGGGWVIGTLDTYEGPCRALANGAGCVVVSVDYRLAPEHKFPAAAEDCYAATRWVAENAPALDVDPTRLAVGGDSAGGNLAAAVALMARDRGGPPLAFQLLVYPATDARCGTASCQEYADGYFLTKAMVAYFWAQYLATEADGRDPYASPLQAPDLGGLPPALVLTAEYDPLRDEGEAYAARLRDAGVRATVARYDGAIHGVFSFGAVLDQAKAVRAEAASALRAAFAP